MQVWSGPVRTKPILVEMVYVRPAIFSHYSTGRSHLPEPSDDASRQASDRRASPSS